MNDTLTPCPPARPVAAYIGGKKLLAARIIGRIAAIPHDTYVEPFVGMGGVFLRRPFRAKAEVINDLSGDVATLFRVLQRHYQALMDMLRWQLTSREEFQRLLGQAAEALTDMERAARFLYVQRLAFGGKVAGRSFGVSVGLPGRFDVGKLEPLLAAVHERLSGVVIERLPYQQMLPRYDRPGTLFYLDPPYWGSEGDYGAGVWAPEDFDRLAELLDGLAGRWILSINDTPEVRRIFGRFPRDRAEVAYTVGSAPGGKRFAELIITDGREG